MARLAEQDVRKRLAALEGWSLVGDAIRKEWRFDSFKAAVAFVNRVAEIADALDHHPDILVQYTRVTLTSTSHDTGALTERDFGLAGRIDEAAAS